jgi:hypothetical protein
MTTPVHKFGKNSDFGSLASYLADPYQGIGCHTVWILGLQPDRRYAK